jgi:hypothetical protein
MREEKFVYMELMFRLTHLSIAKANYFFSYLQVSCIGFLRGVTSGRNSKYNFLWRHQIDRST